MDKNHGGHGGHGGRRPNAPPPGELADRFDGKGHFVRDC